MHFLQAYQNYDLVLGMRFHANVCPLGMGVPTRGLLNYPQVGLLYEELGLEDRLLDVRTEDFAPALQKLTLHDLDNVAAIRARYAIVAAEVENTAGAVLQSVNAWLHAQHD